MTSSIIDFLEARLKEDEDAANKAGGREWTYRGHVWLIVDHEGEPVVYEEGKPNWFQAVHILRHGPARVLREVQAKRAIIEAHPIDTQYDHVTACRACQWDVDCDAPRNDLEPSDCPCPTLCNLAWTWHTVEGWDKAWCPHHEEDHTEVEREGSFRAFKRTCRHCEADLGVLLKPRLDGV